MKLETNFDNIKKSANNSYDKLYRASMKKWDNCKPEVYIDDPDYIEKYNNDNLIRNLIIIVPIVTVIGIKIYNKFFKKPKVDNENIIKNSNINLFSSSDISDAEIID